MKKDNRIIVDLKKVQWARFYYRNQHGQTRNTMPSCQTFYNEQYDPSEEACYLADHIGETIGQRLQRRGIYPDNWVAEITLKLTAHEFLIYKAEKAVSIYKEFCRRVFEKKK